MPHDHVPTSAERLATMADVSDGDAVLEGVDPPTPAELAAAEDLSPPELQAVIEEHVAEVNIVDGGDS